MPKSVKRIVCLCAPMLFLLAIVPARADNAEDVQQVLQRHDGSYVVLYGDGSIFVFDEAAAAAVPLQAESESCGSYEMLRWNVPGELSAKMARYKAMAVPAEEALAALAAGRIVPASTRGGLRPMLAAVETPSPGFAEGGGELYETMTEYDFCDITVNGYTATATTCGPDCHGDCDEGHDGTTCHAHTYITYGSGGYRASWIDDFVDCCECTVDGSGGCGSLISTSNCGACSSNPGGILCWPGGGFPSCCPTADDNGLMVRSRSRTTSRSYWTKTLTINPGDSGTLENRVSIKSGGKEDCNNGADEGWHYGWSSQYEPDRSVSTQTVGSYAYYSWSGSLPTISGSGYSYYCGTLPECNDPICPE